MSSNASEVIVEPITNPDDFTHIQRVVSKAFGAQARDAL